MWQRNNGQSEAEKLQNRFTSYLVNRCKQTPEGLHEPEEPKNLYGKLPGGRSLVFRI